MQVPGNPTPGGAPAGGISAEDLKFEKFKVQLKRLPEPAVRNNMIKEGISNSDIDKFFIKQAGGAGAGGGGSGGGSGGAEGGFKKPAQPEGPPPGTVTSTCVMSMYIVCHMSFE